MHRLKPTLFWISCLAALPSTVSATLTTEPRCALLAKSVLHNARVESVETVPPGSFQLTQDHSLTGLPSFCRVRGVAKPTQRSNIQFEVWLPISNWNGRIQMVGNGGYSPAMNLGQLATLVGSGSVAVATDTGHSGDADDLTFGNGNDDAIADWGYRSVHASIVQAKALVTTFYGKPAQKTYFLGCSTGGHQGLVEAHRYPEDFDGILAGAPANNRTNLNLSFLWRFIVTHTPGDTRTLLTPADLERANNAVMGQCDGLDGVRDGVVADPMACKFDEKRLQCSAGKTNDCLSEKQVEIMKKIYDPLKRRDTGDEIYTGWVAGSEWVKGAGGWHRYWADPNNPGQPMRVEYFRGWAYGDPNWNWWSFDWAKDVDFVRKRLGPMTDMREVDLGAFRKRGGKIIFYHGWVDPVVSALDTIAYFEGLKRANPDASEFARLFMVPGMGHCSGGPGATNFSFAMDSDADHDAVLALQRWVEEGRAPDRIVATRYTERTPASGVAMTRPLCSWPRVPTYTGKGSTDDAANFECR